MCKIYILDLYNYMLTVSFPVNFQMFVLTKTSLQRTVFAILIYSGPFVVSSSVHLFLHLKLKICCMDHKP